MKYKQVWAPKVNVQQPVVEQPIPPEQPALEVRDAWTTVMRRSATKSYAAVTATGSQTAAAGVLVNNTCDSLYADEPIVERIATDHGGGILPLVRHETLVLECKGY